MLAIIGGTGLYALEAMSVDAQVDGATPFGAASGPISKGRLGRHEVLFLARHGAGHRLLPHEINYRANIYALKRAGATRLLGFSAVGSLAERIAPGDLAVPSQYFDWTQGGRERSFFGGGVAAHVSTARPVSANLLDWIATTAQAQDIALHAGVTYACVAGPRLGTRAESLFLRHAGCDLVGMTNVPEAFLACEAQLCYATIGVVTDYDCWMDDPAHHATVGAILERYRAGLGRATALLAALLDGPLPAEDPALRHGLDGAVLTPDASLSAGQLEWLGVLRR
jgi:5'-methylthioadenosine phosphorylase